MTTIVPTVADVLEERRRHVYDLLLAICTVCAQPRQAKRPRNRDYRTETGDLKCGSCGKVTRHALIKGLSHDERTWAFASECRTTTATSTPTSSWIVCAPGCSETRG